jgi:hypothetical protein
MFVFGAFYDDKNRQTGERHIGCLVRMSDRSGTLVTTPLYGLSWYLVGLRKSYIIGDEKWYGGDFSEAALATAETGPKQLRLAAIWGTFGLLGGAETMQA